MLCHSIVYTGGLKKIEIKRITCSLTIPMFYFLQEKEFGIFLQFKWK